MTFRTILAASAALERDDRLVGESMPNYGPNATGDSFGKPPSGTNPPGFVPDAMHMPITGAPIIVRTGIGILDTGTNKIAPRPISPACFRRHVPRPKPNIERRLA